MLNRLKSLQKDSGRTMTVPSLTLSSFSFRFSSLGSSRVSSRSRAYFFSLAPLVSRDKLKRVGGHDRRHTYAFYLLFYPEPGAAAYVLRRRRRGRRRCCMQVILRGKLRSLGSTPRPGPTGKNRFLRRALPFLLASSLFAPRECLDSSLTLFLFFSSRSPRSYLFRLFLFSYLSLSFSFFLLYLALSFLFSAYSLSNSLERVDAAWANP